MASTSFGSGTPVRHLRDFADLFRKAENPGSAGLIGIEGEHLSISLNGLPATWAQHEGAYRWLVENKGYTPAPDPMGNLTSVKKDGAGLTPEPGCQLEISDRPFSDLNQMAASFRQRQAEAVEAAEANGFRIIAMGFNPVQFAPLDFVQNGMMRPGPRYMAMMDLSLQAEPAPESEARILHNLHNRGHNMMFRTATMQANVDFLSEEDAERKTQVMDMIALPLSAIFNNSAYLDGRLSPVQSVRNENNRNAMGGRTGALFPAAWPNGRGGFYDRASYHYVFENPMFASYDANNNFVDMRGQDIHDLMRKGLFTSVGAANHIGGIFYANVRPQFGRGELRSIDKNPLEMQNGMAAMVYPLTQDPDAARAVLERTKHIGPEARRWMHLWAPRTGLQTPVAENAGETILDLCRDLHDIARSSLARRGRGEEKLLEPVEFALKTGENWAQRLARRCGDDWRKAARLMDCAVNDGGGISVFDDEKTPSSPVAYADMAARSASRPR